MKEEQNGHEKVVTEYITLPVYTDIEKMETSQITEVKKKVDKYSEILARIIRARIG